MDDNPAWLTCEDLFSKIKTELITQAMDTLDIAVNEKLLDIKGSLITVADKPSDTEMKMFIINKIIEEKEKIVEMYNGYLLDIQSSEKLNADRLEQKERLEKFLLYVEKISTLMDYSTLLDAWMNEMSMEVLEKNPSEIIKKTINNSRRKILEYVLRNSTMVKEEILDNDERKILEDSLV
jgi:hypothetical protein